MVVTLFKLLPEEPAIDLNEEFEDFSKTLADLDIDTELPTELETEFSADGSKNPIVDKFGQDPKGPPLPPFPELRYLNLSYNLVIYYLFRIIHTYNKVV